MKLYVSRRPEKIGGGSNTFAWNFVSKARGEDHEVVERIQEAERAIIIANHGDISDLREAKARGCFIIHRIDEYFERDETPSRGEKHFKIKELNAQCDVTVFQSRAVRDNAYPFIQPKRYSVILNGADPYVFHPASKLGEYIGHVTWSVDRRKGLNVLYEFIRSYSKENFLLIGRHGESEYNFKLPNVMLRGVKDRNQIAREYRSMKLLLFPSANEPCPNTPIEAILSGVPVCYHDSGGTPELVRDCGALLGHFEHMLKNLTEYREKCVQRQDLYFDRVFKEYMAL